ncbi:MAG: hypothetical protein NTU59_01545, partial [Coprothermobacterota bacterium]|nr:hypothetical protein [Coprothermobacterota bacterium]
MAWRPITHSAQRVSITLLKMSCSRGSGIQRTTARRGGVIGIRSARRTRNCSRIDRIISSRPSGVRARRRGSPPAKAIAFGNGADQGSVGFQPGIHPGAKRDWEARPTQGSRHPTQAV